MESLIKGVDCGHLTHLGCQFRAKFRAEYAPLSRIFYFVRCHKSSIILQTFDPIGDGWGNIYTYINPRVKREKEGRLRCEGKCAFWALVCVRLYI